MTSLSLSRFRLTSSVSLSASTESCSERLRPRLSTSLTVASSLETLARLSLGTRS